MKKFVILAFLMQVIISCKRDRTCSCGPKYRIDAPPYEFVIHDTKKEAEKRCHDTPNPWGDISVAPYCEIDR